MNNLSLTLNIIGGICVIAGSMGLFTFTLYYNRLFKKKPVPEIRIPLPPKRVHPRFLYKHVLAPALKEGHTYCDEDYITFKLITIVDRSSLGYQYLTYEMENQIFTHSVSNELGFYEMAKSFKFGRK